jgi:hypothetical protein
MTHHRSPILDSCATELRRLKDLSVDILGGSLYRHAKRLIKIGRLSCSAG